MTLPLPWILALLGPAALVACNGDDGTPMDAGREQIDAAALPDAALGDAAARDATLDAGAPEDASSRDGGGAPRGLGTVIERSDPCTAGALPGSTCRALTVSCPGVPDLEVSLRISPPAGGVAERGTIVFGTGGGGGGGGFYEDAAGQAASLLARVQGAGFRVVDRAWADAWERGTGGMYAVACRYATLITWVHSEIHAAGGAFCATGNSGGSSEIAYALARYGRGDVLDLAVPTGGPPMGRMDRACLDGEDPAWLSECRTQVEAAGGCAAVSCEYTASNRMIIDAAYGSETPCASRDESARAMLHADSVLSPDATLSTPRTRVHSLFGARDCTVAVAVGYPYAAAVTSENQIDFLPSTGHAVFATVEGADAMDGADAIFGAIDSGCAPRH